MIAVPAQALADAQGADGELYPVLLALARFESGYNPGAIGDNGCSYGYLQMNRCGGLGAPYSEAQLLDGPTNMRLGAQYIRGRLAAGASLYDALSPWSVRPQAWELLQDMQAQGIEGAGGSGAALALGGAEGGGFLVALAAAALWFLLG